MNNTKKIPKYARKIVVAITLLCLSWYIVTFLNRGLEIRPAILLFILFITIAATGYFVRTGRHKKIIARFRQKNPNFNFDKALKIFFIVAIVIGIVVRLSFLFMGNRYGQDMWSDHGIHLYFANTIANGESIDQGIVNYEAIFPHLITYSATLTVFTKILGAGYHSIVLSNLLFDLISAATIFGIFRLLKKPRAAQIATILWLLNPIEILFCALGLSVVVTNTFIMFTFLATLLIIRAIYLRKAYTLIFASIFLGIVISVGNAYRPIFTIFFIALAIYLVLYIIQYGKTPVLYCATSFIFTAVFMFGCGKIINYAQHCLNPSVPQNTSVGWNIFVGANYETAGHWSVEDATIFSEKISNIDFSKATEQIPQIQSFFTQEAISRYQAMEWNIPNHLLNKSERLFADDSETITKDFLFGFRINENNALYQTVHSVGMVLLVALIILALAYIMKQCQAILNLTTPTNDFIFFLCLSLCGLIAAFCLVEVQRRYTMPLLPILTILATYCISPHLFRKTIKPCNSK